MRTAALLAILTFAIAVGCSSSSSTNEADASACPAQQPNEGDACTSFPDGTRCVFGDGCSASTVALVCSGGRWAKGAFTARCDGGTD